MNYKIGWQKIRESAQTILEHQYITYSDISAKDLAVDHARMNTQYNPNQLFENIVDQIEETVELAGTAKALYTIPQIIGIR